MNEIILKNENGQIVTSSRDVAEKFGKRHDKLMSEIERMYWELTDKGIAQNGGHPLFYKNIYIHPQNHQEYSEYLMNRDGFSLLCMGFTGKKALEWKLKYINAFNVMEEKLKSGDYLTDEERYKLQLFSKDPSEVAYAHQKLIDLATAPLIAENAELRPKADYHDEVLNKEGLITTTVVAKDLGFKSAAKLNQIMFLNNIIFKNKSGTWCPYADYEWLITEGYADYKSYENEHSKPCLKWTEKGRKWIVKNYNKWVTKLVA